MNSLAAVLSLASGGAAGWGLFRLLFEGWEDFGECLRFWLTPDWLSAVRGEWTEDQWSELRLFLWAAGHWAISCWAERTVSDRFPADHPNRGGRFDP